MRVAPFLLLFASSLAFADEQTLRYELSLDGQKVGSREVKLRYLPPDPELGGFETRVIESVLTLDAAHGGSSFTCAVKENGVAREVQGRRNRDLTWTVTTVTAQGAVSKELRSSEAALSSLDLLDPTSHLRLLDGPDAAVLIAESGDALRGPVSDLGEGTVSAGGQLLSAHRYAWGPTAARSTFAYGQDGLLLAYEMAFAGHTLRATLAAPPTPRDFGDVLVVPFGGENSAVIETPL